MSAIPLRPKTPCTQAAASRACGPVSIVLLVGICASLLLFSRVRNWEKENAKKEFEQRVTPYAQTLEKTLSDYTGALHFLGDHFDHTEFVSRESFSGIVGSMMPRYPGIQTFGWDPLVTDAERSDYVQRARDQGYPSFDFMERIVGGELVPAAKRDEYVVVYYLHPLEGNEAAFGYDIASDLVRREGIAKAFSTGQITVTAPIRLVQESEDQFGVLMLRPVYKSGAVPPTPEERLTDRKGLVVEVLRVGSAVNTALANFDAKKLSLTLTDMTAPPGKQYLFHLPPHREKTAVIHAEKADEAGLYFTYCFSFCDREYQVVIRPTEAYFSAQPISPAIVYLVGCLLIVLLLSLYLLGRFQHLADAKELLQRDGSGI